MIIKTMMVASIAMLMLPLVVEAKIYNETTYIDTSLVPENVVKQIPTPEPIVEEEIKDSEVVVEEVEPTYTQTSETFEVGSEGVSTYYSNTVIYPPRSYDQTVYTSTDENGMCIGTTDYVNWYQCVVLPETLSDTYYRGDNVSVSYSGEVKECIVIDYNQTAHGNKLNFVGDFHYQTGDIAWLVEEQ